MNHLNILMINEVMNGLGEAVLFVLLINNKLVLLKQILTAYSAYIQRPCHTHIHNSVGKL